MVGGCRYPLSEDFVVLFASRTFDDETGKPLGGLDDQLIVTQGFCFVK
jgi:hypothetical protein